MRINKLIPTEIYLPHFTIFVEFVTQKDLSDETDAEFDYGEQDGKWVGTISILKTLNQKEQLAAFGHELQHAMVDYLDVLVNCNRAKRSRNKK